MARTLTQKAPARKPTATARKPDFFTVQLRESVVQAGQLVVNEAEGYIDNVKMAGMESENIPTGVRGCTKGTRYTDRAYAGATKLYEGANSDRNHNVAPANNPNHSDPNERLGWWTNVRHVPGQGMFGRYNVYKSDPFAAKLFEMAKRNPKACAMSHNAFGKGNVIDGWFVIDEITQVDSIDCVKDGGTTVALNESKRQGRRPMKSTLRRILESSNNPAVQAFVGKSHVVRLLEMDGLGETVLDEPAAADATALTWKSHLGELLKALAQDEAMDPAEMRKKAMAALKLLETGDEPEGSVKIEESDDDAEGDDKEDKDEEKKKKEAEAKESKLAKLQTEKDVRKLCESNGWMNAPESDIETIAAVPAASRAALIERLKGTQRQTVTVKSQPAGTLVKESRQGDNDKRPTRPLLR